MCHVTRPIVLAVCDFTDALVDSARHDIYERRRRCGVAAVLAHERRSGDMYETHSTIAYRVEIDIHVPPFATYIGPAVLHSLFPRLSVDRAFSF